VIVVAWGQGLLSFAHRAWRALAFFAVVLAGFAIAAAVWEQLLFAHPGANELDYPNFEGRGLAMVAIYVSAGATFIAVVHDLSRHLGAIEVAAGVQPWWAGDPPYSRPER
jgi:hypothetical protein